MSRSLRRRLCAAPILLAALVAAWLSSAASAAGTQAIDRDLQVRCTFDEPFWSLQSIRVTGTAPATTAPGEPVDLSDLRVQLNFFIALSGDYGRVFSVEARLEALRLGATGTTTSGVDAELPPGGLPATSPERSDLALPVRTAVIPVGSLTTAGAAPVVVDLEAIGYSATLTRWLDDGSVEPPPTDPSTEAPFDPSACAILPGQNPLVVIPSTAPVPPPTGPEPVRVSGTAYAGIGGLVRITGKRLAGARVTVGGRRATVLYATASEVWIVAPARSRGRQPVVVTTAAGTSPVSGAPTITYR